MRGLAHFEDWGEGEWFRNLPAQVVTGICFGVFALLGLSGMVAGTTGGERIWGAVLLSLGTTLVSRSVIAPTLEVNPRALVVRKLLRTRKLAWSDVAEVAIGEGQTGMNSGQREFLVLHLRDGTTVRHTELNAPSGRRHRSPCRVHDALAAANRQLRRQAGERS